MIALIVHKYTAGLEDPCCYPLGFMYVSAILKAQGHKVKVLNYNLWDYDLDEELKGVSDVFMTGFEEFRDRIIETAAICREKGIRTHLGGALATFTPEDMAGHVNCLYHGEYDAGMSLDKVPYPDYKGFYADEYHRRNGYTHIGVLTSRGCPHNCTFCAHTCKFRARSIADVEREVDLYKTTYQPDMLVFNDNTLNFTKARFSRIIDMMHGKGMAWSAALRLDNVDDSLIERAKSAGMKFAVLGVESFDQEQLDRFNKQIKVEQIEKGLELFERSGIKYVGNILIESVAGIAKYMDKFTSYNLFPTPIKNFVGTSIKAESDPELDAICTKFANMKGYAFNA